MEQPVIYTVQFSLDEVELVKTALRCYVVSPAVTIDNFGPVREVYAKVATVFAKVAEAQPEMEGEYIRLKAEDLR